jgi:uncharacterized protein
MDLIGAVESGDLERVRELLAADPGQAAEEQDGIPAVRIALYRRQPAIKDALLEAGPPLDGLDRAALGDVDGLRTALATEEDLVTRRSADGFTALHYACFFGGPEVTKLLLDHGAEPNAPADNASHVRPLHSAAAARDAASAVLLLAAGADPDAQQAGGFTALHAAAQHDDAELAGALLRAGADPAIRDDKGADAVAMARANESVAVLALLG